MQILKKEGVFRLYDRNTSLILTDEKQLKRIAENPDKPLFDDEERGFSGEKKGLYPPGTTLDSFMKDAKDRGCERVEISYDFFFGGSKRENYPDSELTIRAYKVVHEYAAKYGMTFGASLVSPLDLGGGYVKTHTDRGYTWQMAEGEIVNGRFSVEMRRQRQWYNNKGPIQLALVRAMALAFSEEYADNGRDLYVDEKSIEWITENADVSVDESKYVITGSGYAYDMMNVSGEYFGKNNRVLILAEYATPEQDYFAPDALDYIKGVIDQHAKEGITYNGFYSDEMHIQFDWDLNEHFGPTEIQTRYVTDSLIDEFSKAYGEKYRDFAKQMVYFAYTPHDGVYRQHVIGKDAEGLYQTVLFRKRYFEMLSRRVINLSLDAKKYAESLFGAPIMTLAHATWQESPTCDHFSEDFRFSEENRKEVSRYDYDKPYVWSSTIRENTSACGDYFRWNEYLTGSGTDHPEGGYADRNYYAQAFASSLGSLNVYNRAYCASWGSPNEVIRRLKAVGATYGTGDFTHGLIQNMHHRLSDVLLLYPTELNYAEERFGSWMIQYGYANYITEEKLLAHASVTDDGLIHIGKNTYRAVVALFEPFVYPETKELLERFVLSGGKLVWSGPAPLRYESGKDATGDFMNAFGLAGVTPMSSGIALPDEDVEFEGMLRGIPAMRARTDMLPDRFYPVQAADAQVVARAGGKTVATAAHRGKGICVYLGFRPRDDQSKSTGEDVSTLFDILMRLEAYDKGSLEAKSRPESSRYIANKFSNGCVTIANHYRTFYEAWYGTFFRDEEEDKKLLSGRKLPPIEIELEEDEFDGHIVTYSGEGAVSFRVNDQGDLIGFAGEKSKAITIDGRKFEFFSVEADVAFTEIEKERLAPGVRKLILAKSDRPGTLSIPATKGFEHAKAGLCMRDCYKIDEDVNVRVQNGEIVVEITEKQAGLWIGIYIPEGE
ncbi:MAG: hypothetical protein IJC48_05525 [Clostridia bacterium]|nr:hypothetical protein [Clostridia bacterium]